MTIQNEAQKLNPSALIEFFVIDLTPIGGDILRLHPGVNEHGEDVVWRGEVYYRFPLEAEGFEMTTQGAIPRPLIRVANIASGALGPAEHNQASDFSKLVLEWGDLVGCRVTRYKTLLKFLDAVNFKAGNPDADPDQYFPPDIYYIDRKTNEDPLVIEFELIGATDIAGVRLPGRQINRTTCVWQYRGDDCGYSGPPVATGDDVPTTDPDKDVCSHRLSGCKLRFSGTLPIGCFPGAGQTV